MKQIAKITVREPNNRIAFIPISDTNKPEIATEIYDNWQKLLNMVAELLHVPAALIMRVHKEKIEVCLADEGEYNPYKQGETEELGKGLYCETVLGNQASLAVPNALTSTIWKDNPDIPLHMISYMGYLLHGLILSYLVQFVFLIKRREILVKHNKIY